MTGDKKKELYRIIRGKKIRFFKVKMDDVQGLVVIELEHVDGSAQGFDVLRVCSEVSEWVHIRMDIPYPETFPTNDI